MNVSNRGWWKAAHVIGALLLGIAAIRDANAAREVTVTVAPAVKFNHGVTSQPHPIRYFDTPEEAFADGKIYWDYIRPGSTITAENLRPSSNPAYTINGHPDWYVGDTHMCSPPNGCVVHERTSFSVSPNFLCPNTPKRVGRVLYRFNHKTTYNGIHRQVTCQMVYPELEPCDDCNARGNPVHPGTGEKLQRETDYIAPGGLALRRTYRSGASAAWSDITSFIHDLSFAAVNQNRCVQDYVDAHGVRYPHCFNYQGTATAEYQLLTSEGRMVRFTGSPAAPVARPDINDRLTQATVDGSLHWVAYRANNDVEVYALSGHLKRSISSDGSGATQYEYSVAGTPSGIAPRPGLLIRKTDPFGRQLNLTYDAAARLSTVTDPGSGLFRYEYDAASNVASVTYPDLKKKRYHYNEPAYINSGAACAGDFPRALTGITDENDARHAIYKYDCLGRAISTEHAGGAGRHEFIYDVWGTDSPAREVGPSGTQRTLLFKEIESVRRPAGIVQPGPGGVGTVSTEVVYDPTGNALSRTDFNGNKSCSAYGARNLESTRVEGLPSSAQCTLLTAVGAALPVNSRKTSRQWHPDWRLETKLAEPGRIVTTVYNGQPDPFNGNAIASCAPASALLPGGKRIAVVCKRVEQSTNDANGATGFSAALQTAVPSRIWKWTYNEAGQVLSEDGPRTDVTDVTNYVYYTTTTADYTKGDLQRVTNAAGKPTQFTKYNKHGQVLESVDPNSVLTVNEYYPRQWLKSTTVDGQKTSYDHDAVGQLKKVTLPDSSFIEYEYDDAHRLKAVKDNLSNRTEYILDNAGNRTGETTTDPGVNLRRQLTRMIDALGRVQKTTGRE